MAKKKKSFFERLTGAVNMEEEYYDDEYEEEETTSRRITRNIEPESTSRPAQAASGWADQEEEEEGQLTVDVYQTAEDIILKTMVAGVKPDDLDISITRDMVTIKGRREGSRNISENDFFHKELYWGSFSRTVLLPQEIDVEAAEAVEKHGLLILKLPKINKEKTTKLKVKSH